MSTQHQQYPIQWEDIVFEKRNKDYGAYLLRALYSRHLVFALLVTSLFLAFLLALPTLTRLFYPEEKIVDATPDKPYIGCGMILPPLIDKPKVITPVIDLPPPPVKTLKFVIPKVTPQQEVPQEDMPTMEDANKNITGTKTVDIPGDAPVLDTPVEVVAKAGTVEDKVFTFVEQQAEYPGGMADLYKFIAKHMKYPPAARRMEAQGSVYVSFVIDKEGKISDIRVDKGIHADCDKEAIRVIQLMPPWKPGKQNGEPVKSRFVLPIKFKLRS